MVDLYYLKMVRNHYDVMYESWVKATTQK